MKTKIVNVEIKTDGMGINTILFTRKDAYDIHHIRSYRGKNITPEFLTILLNHFKMVSSSILFCKEKSE